MSVTASDALDAASALLGNSLQEKSLKVGKMTVLLKRYDKKVRAYYLPHGESGIRVMVAGNATETDEADAKKVVEDGLVTQLQVGLILQGIAEAQSADLKSPAQAAVGSASASVPPSPKTPAKN